MARKDIPAQTVWICDCCASELNNGNWRLHGSVHVNADALDFSGAAVASDNQRYDLCDTCFTAVKKAVIETIKGKETPCDTSTQ